MTGIFRTIYESYHQQFGTGGYGLILLPVMMLLWRRGKEQAGLKQLFEGIAVAAAVIFFPVSAWIIAKGIDGIYWRSFWLLPVFVLLGWGATEAVFSLHGRWKRVLAAAGCLAVIALNGRLLFQGEFFSNRENNFKLPTMVIRTADEVNAHALSAGVKNKKVVATTDIAELIRVYDASIRQRYGRRAMTKEERQSRLYREINAEQPDYSLLAERARVAHCTYLIMHQAQDDRQEMEKLGYQLIFEEKGYVIYYDPSQADYEEGNRAEEED